MVRYNADAEMARRRFADHPRVRLAYRLRDAAIETVVDVGANSGQYGRRLRQLGYTGRLISFEPLGSAFETLQERAQKDGRWEAHRLALGEAEGEVELNVAANSQSSSLLEILPAHLEAAPDARAVERETVAVRTLDAVLSERPLADGPAMLKLDVQGYEQRVLEGARQVLPRFSLLQIEMSLVPLYDGELGFAAMLDELAARDWLLLDLFPGFSDPESGRLLQVDGLFRPAPGRALR